MLAAEMHLPRRKSYRAGCNIVLFFLRRRSDKKEEVSIISPLAFVYRVLSIVRYGRKQNKQQHLLLLSSRDCFLATTLKHPQPRDSLAKMPSAPLLGPLFALAGWTMVMECWMLVSPYQTR